MTHQGLRGSWVCRRVGILGAANLQRHLGQGALRHIDGGRIDEGGILRERRTPPFLMKDPQVVGRLDSAHGHGAAVVGDAACMADDALPAFQDFDLQPAFVPLRVT